MLSRPHIVYVHDLVMAFATVMVALALRLGGDFTWFVPVEKAVLAAGIFTAICAVVFRWQGLYRGVWRYASTRDMVQIARATTIAVVLFVPAMFMVTRLDDLPRSLPFIMWFVLTALLGGPRFVYRIWKDRGLRNVLGDGERIPVLLIGAGDGAEMFLRAMERNPHAEYEVVGILAEQPRRLGMDIREAAVLGLVSDFPKVVERLKAQGNQPRRVILTRDDMDREVVSTLFAQAQGLGMTMARMPRMTHLREGVEDRVELRPIAIEDLLGRPQAALDRDAMRRLVEGRRVLITGAGGSIGSELVRQIAALDPAAVTLVDASEFALYRIDLEIAETFPALPRVPRIADVRDPGRIDAVFAEARPQLVLHAAALKHVPMVEENPLEGLRTNALGTRTIADACRRHGVGLMVLISTDKAVNPTNVMGASKRMAELYCQALDVAGRAEGATRFVTVRFGNVLGSTGSVVPLFRRQLERGGPLTVTHPDVTRYFMTIREAVELVLEASAIGVADDAYEGRIFVLDMGKPVKIIDLARQMIRLAGREPDRDVQIVITGLRPGEKLFEEIFHGAEPPVPTEHEGLLLATPRVADLAWLSAALDRLDAACRSSDAGAALRELTVLVPEYQPPPHHGDARAAG